MLANIFFCIGLFEPEPSWCVRNCRLRWLSPGTALSSLCGRRSGWSISLEFAHQTVATESRAIGASHMHDKFQFYTNHDHIINPVSCTFRAHPWQTSSVTLNVHLKAFTFNLWIPFKTNDWRRLATCRLIHPESRFAQGAPQAFWTSMSARTRACACFDCLQHQLTLEAFSSAAIALSNRLLANLRTSGLCAESINNALLRSMLSQTAIVDARKTGIEVL